MKPYYKDDNSIIYNASNENVFKIIKDKQIKLLFADPPYGIGLEYDGQFTDDMKYYEKSMDILLTEGLRVSDTMVVTPGGYTSVQLWYKRMSPRWRFCWYKGATATRSAVGFSHWEEILIYGDKVYGDIPDYIFVSPSRDFVKYDHPCPKPLSLLLYFIKAYTKPGDIIFDPYAGSGTTLVAGKMLDRKVVGAEISPKYCELISKRLSEVIVFPEAGLKEVKTLELFEGYV